MPLHEYSAALEAIYRQYNTRKEAKNDPVRFLYEYDDPADREVVGLLAAMLAYGRVEQILKSVRNVLDRIGPHPVRYLAAKSSSEIFDDFADFRHRVTGGVKLAALLEGIRFAVAEQGSLEATYIAARSEAADPVDALCRFVRRIDPKRRCDHLLPDPVGGSACKRLHLFLRWMVRRDAVDPGGWSQPSPAELLIPLDTHMSRWALLLGLTSRR
ncbi:MAG: DUF2400 domain-containing protein, partial [Pirellulales bacterium]|nr:DUF2400 domain-containing protein [Pirellulales bacterium]